MNWNFLGTNWQLFGAVAAVTLAAMLTAATGLAVHVHRLHRRPTLPISEGVGARKAVLGKVRRGESLSAEELEFAHRIVDDHRAPLAFCMPAALLSLGLFYVFGSLEQLHGATPSERTFLGVIPMFSTLNLTAQLLRVAKLKKRLPVPA